MNIYREPLMQVSFLKSLDLSDFDNKEEQTYASASLIFQKGALIYNLEGSPLLLCAHSDQFSATPNEVSWYRIIESNDDKISLISKIEEEEALGACKNEHREELDFYLGFIRGD